jgi:hypothetical protein
MRNLICILSSGVLLMLGAQLAVAQGDSMSFFVTSEGSGNGGDLGGLEGADAHCEALADAVGAGDREWRAYLGTEADGGRGVSARTRIGDGPWYNSAGAMVAANVDDLHISPNLAGATALDENGDRINGFGTQPNRHDTLTGSMEDGTAFFPDDDDHTCSNWMSSGEGSAQVGHTDRHGGGNTSWNAAHASRGCSQMDLQGTGGAGLFYCFAAD